MARIQGKNIDINPSKLDFFFFYSAIPITGN